MRLMNSRNRNIDKCYTKWGERISNRKIMSRRVEGKKYDQIIVVPKEQIEDYKRDGWKIWLE